MSEKIIVIHQTVLQSWARTAGTLTMLAAFIGLGVVLDSTAMQWVGAIIGFIVMGRLALWTADKSRMSIPEARRFLDRLEGRVG